MSEGALMAKKKQPQRKAAPPPQPVAVEESSPVLRAVALVCCTVLYFIVTSLLVNQTAKRMAFLTILVFIGLLVLGFNRLRAKIRVPLLLLAAVVTMDGISTLYAVSGKFALYEFLKVFNAFVLVLVFMTIAPAKNTGRWFAKVLAGFSAIAGLVSIDMISTRLISGAVVGFLNLFTTEYTTLSGIEVGVRMTSLYTNPNVFAGVAGIGVLLSLGITDTAESKTERNIFAVILYINSLAFLLAFSMGATASIVVAFLILLILQKSDRRSGLLILMVETLILTVIAAAIISVTSFQEWTGYQPVPLICTIVGAAALCGLDMLAGQRLTAILDGKRKLVPVLIAVIIAAVVLFVVVAYNLTGNVSLDAGEGLRRAAYPDPGTYTLAVETDHPITVTIESQNQQETMMHTSTVLYTGDPDGAEIEVPEDSLVVYFNMNAPEGATIQSFRFSGEAGEGSVPLGYKLLPGFIANRLQGLWANENAIQRFVFFADGLKIFRRSPLIGLGLGAFENGILGVQSFFYETKYAHNHYIQALAETGIIGFVLFVLLIVGSAAAIFFNWRKKENADPLTPILGAALVYMAVHGATEVVFSAYPYLPMAFGTFAIISVCCGDSLPKVELNQKAQTISVAVMAVLIFGFSVLLFRNMRAHVASDENTLAGLERAAVMDPYEWADHALSYVDSVAGQDIDEQTAATADALADRLAKVNSNTIPIHLAEYYFLSDRTEQAFAMLEKYVDYVSSRSSSWDQAFASAMNHQSDQTDTDAWYSGVKRLVQMLDTWNEENMGEITLEDEIQEFVDWVRTQP